MARTRTSRTHREQYLYFVELGIVGVYKRLRTRFETAGEQDPHEAAITYLDDLIAEARANVSARNR